LGICAKALKSKEIYSQSKTLEKFFWRDFPTGKCAVGDFRCGKASNGVGVFSFPLCPLREGDSANAG